MVKKQVVIASGVAMALGAVLRTAIVPSGTLVTTATQEPLTLSDAPAIASGPPASLILGGLLIGIAVLVQVLRKRGLYPREARYGREADSDCPEHDGGAGSGLARGEHSAAKRAGPARRGPQAWGVLPQHVDCAKMPLKKAEEVAQQGESENVVKFARLASAHVQERIE